MTTRTTYNLSTTLMQHIQERATMAERYAIKQSLDSFLAAWEAYDGKEPIETVGKALTNLTDALLQPAKKAEGAEARITCGKGCAHCCRQAVQISPPEAALLIATAKEKGLQLDEVKLRLQSRLDDDMQWATQLESVRTCVFLGEDNTCQVYEHRPIACRKYFSISDPELCDLYKHPGGAVLTWFGLDAEIMASAVITFFGADYMPRMLLAELKREREGEPDAKL